MLVRLGHIILSFLIFFSSTGVVLNKHYCQEELKSVSMFLHAKPCHEAKAMKVCPMHADMNQNSKDKSKGCCDDETEIIKADQEKVNYSFEIETEISPVFLQAFVTSFFYNEPEIAEENSDFRTYRPPIIIHDLPIELQSILC